MAYRIDDDENRIQDLKDKIDQLEVQTFSPEVVGRNESTRDTGIQTGDSAATNSYPLWMPIRDFGTLGNLTLEILLNRVDGHVAKMTLNGDTDFAFSLPPGTDKMMQFVLDVTIDSTGGYTINLPGNLEPGTITINNAANARTILKIQTTDGAVTYQAQDILTTGGGSAGYDTIQEEGTAVTQRSIMNFIGASVTAVDNPGNSRTDITIVAGTAGLLSDLTIDADKDWAAKKITNLGGITMAGDIDVNTQNIIKIDQSRYVKDSGAVSADTDTVILLNSSNQFQFNTAQANSIAFSLENIAAVTIEHDGTAETRTLSILSDSTNTNSIAELDITKNFATAISGQPIGQITFKAASTAGGGVAEYSAIVGEIEDATSGSIDGSIRFDATLNNVVIPFMSINEGGSGEISLSRDLNVNTQNILNIDQSRYVVDSGVVSSNTDNVILLNSKAQFQFNTNKINDFIWSFDNNAALDLDHDTTTNPDQRVMALLSDSTETDAVAFFRITHSAINAIDTQTIGHYGFYGTDDSGGVGVLEYAAITGEIEDSSNGTIDGSLRLEATVNGSATNFLQINDASSGHVDILRDLDINANFIQFTERALPSNPVANNGLIYVKDDGGISTPFFLDSAGTETSMIESASIGNTIFQGNSNVVVTDTGSDGVVTFATEGTGRGTISSLGWIIKDVNLTIDNSSGKIILDNGFEIQNTNSTNTTFQIPNGENLLIKEGSDTRIQVDNNVTLNANTDNDIIFQGAGTRVGKYDGSTDKWEFEKDILLDSGSRIRSFDSTEIGFFVTNFSGSVGTAGSNQTPSVPSITTSVSNLNNAFGSAIGCWGVYNTGSAFRNIAFKITSSQWLILACPDNGTPSNPVLSDIIG